MMSLTVPSVPYRAVIYPTALASHHPYSRQSAQ